MSKTKQICILIATLGTFGCYTSPDNSSESTQSIEKIEQPLVFGATREVHQTRSQFLYAAGTAQDKTVRQSFVMSAGLMSRSTGMAFLRRLRATNNCSSGDQPSVGSGTLTSDSRFVTAHHVTGFPHPLGDHMFVAFDGRAEVTGPGANGNVFDVGGFYVDDTLATVAPTPYADNAYPQYMFDSVNESPLLANRLFALGLHTWAEDSFYDNKTKSRGIDRRNFLRKWPFEFDDFPNQPFLTLNNNAYQGLDIAILKAKQRDGVMFSSSPGSVDFTPSGKFAIQKPAVFFDQSKAEVFDDETWGYDGSSELFSIYFTRWPQDSEPGYVNLTANNGMLLNGTPQVSPTSGLYCLGAQNQVQVLHNGLVQVGGIDMRKTSSGGGLLSPRIDTYEALASPKLFSHVGTLHAGVSDQGPNQIATWGTPLMTEGDANNHSLYTANTQAVVDWADRDIPFGGSEGEPFFNQIPPSLGQKASILADCVDPDANTCPEYETTPSFDWFVSDEFSDDNVAPQGLEDLQSGDPIGDGSRVNLKCKFNAPSLQGRAINAGVMVGFMGTATETLLTPNTRVGSLYGICAPYTQGSFHDNWGSMHIMGRRPDQDVSMHYNTSTIRTTKLSRALTEQYEKRESATGIDYLRPMSMKTCPPNYILQSVKIKTKITGQREELVGIEALKCISWPGLDANPLNVDIPHSIDVYLASDYYQAGGGEQYHPDKFDDFSLGTLHLAQQEIDFSLDQHIGNPLSGNNPTETNNLTRKWVGCPAVNGIERAMAGFQINMDTSGPIDWFLPTCINVWNVVP